MKKLLAGISLLGFAAVVSAQSITFEQTTLDYGTIKKGSDGNRTFIVKNTGDKPLIIEKVKPSCGCTSPEWSKEPILPGKTGKIAVHYDTNIVNPFQKLIEVYSNDPKNSRSVIYIKGTIVEELAKAPEAKEKAAPVARKAIKKAAK